MKQLSLKQITVLTNSNIELQMPPETQLKWNNFHIDTTSQVVGLLAGYNFRVKVIDSARAAFYLCEGSDLLPQNYPQEYQWVFLPNIVSQGYTFYCDIRFDKGKIKVIRIKCREEQSQEEVWIRLLNSKPLFTGNSFADVIDMNGVNIFSGTHPKSERECSLSISFHDSIKSTIVENVKRKLHI